MVTATRAKFEVYRDARGEYRWRLMNGNIVLAQSPNGYATRQNCLNGIESVKSNVTEAEVTEAL